MFEDMKFSFRYFRGSRPTAKILFAKIIIITLRYEFSTALHIRTLLPRGIKYANNVGNTLQSHNHRHFQLQKISSPTYALFHLGGGGGEAFAPPR